MPLLSWVGLIYLVVTVLGVVWFVWAAHTAPREPSPYRELWPKNNTHISHDLERQRNGNERIDV